MVSYDFLKTVTTYSFNEFDPCDAEGNTWILNMHIIYMIFGFRGFSQSYSKIWREV